jgi:hypothetical protein
MKQFLLFLTLIITFQLQAQNKLVFTKSDSSKVFTVKQNDLVKLSYYGYLKQTQQAEGKVTDLTDSSITLTPRKRFLQKTKLVQTILLKDINGFKRYSNFRPAGQIIYGIVGVGITGTVTAIIANANVPTAASFFSAAATQTLTTAIKNVFFPSKIKNFLNKGWTMQLQTLQ